MTNVGIVKVLEDLAALLEIKGENAFRVRAFRNAAGTLQELSRSVAEMVAAGEDLTALPGVGKDIAAYLAELVTTGRLGRLEEVQAEIPSTLIDLVALNGVGPKKARRLWQELGVTTVDALDAAVRDGRVAAMEGFGARSAAKILQSIEDFRKRLGRTLLVDADEMIRPVVERLRAVEGVERVEVAGSWRRRQETVGDVDILALYDGADPSTVMEVFTSTPGVVRVEAAGGTKGRIVLPSGLPVDLRILPRSSYGAALHYFTGSKEHNVAIRTLGVRRGLRINEYGVFRVEADEMAEGAEAPHSAQDGERLGGETEEEVFASVGLPWIPPVLRRGRGEIDLAREGRLPKLVTLEEIRGDLQMHTPWSDGQGTIEEMARACQARGYSYLALTDHSGGQLAMVRGLTPDKVAGQAREVAEVQAQLEGFTIFRSCEVDILKDGTLDLEDEVLETLDMVLVSVHTHMELDRTRMTDRVIRALENPHVDILGHPTGRILGRREPHAMDVEEVLKAAAALGVAVELNANPWRLDLSDVHVARARELGVPVVISTDAHSVAHLGYMHYGVEQAQRAGLEAQDVLNTLPLEDFRRWLRRRVKRPE
jgi:DNA polymerase (family X)